ncbi:hypothetical protein [Photobacterium galatheae]|uniref:Uncharacterized protein n=1 Tax=Photobacterium galatheae TaxID=1654360 RepID=A0A066RMF1_9GAMM|nr:hypothetical protein [Photobacterium galatheae]KDM90281.1 hypothetical protein EA58_17995 [Photobacterium galatheae]MCM0151718.1 hypothetical protein [Photobacterium galatheae]
MSTKGLLKSCSGEYRNPENTSSIHHAEGKYVFKDTYNRVIDYFTLGGKKEITEEQARGYIDSIVAHAENGKNPMILLPNGNHVRRESVVAIEQHTGEQFRGLIIRGLDNQIIDFLKIDDVSQHQVIADELALALEPLPKTKRHRPDWDTLLTNNALEA